MSDEVLSALERRYNETKSVEDEEAWLRERLRVGALARERLELASYLGHPAAHQIVRSSKPKQRDLLSRIGGMRRWGVEPLVRTSVAIARSTLPQGASRAELLEKLAEVDHWMRDPAARAHPARLLEAAGRLVEDSGFPEDPATPPPSASATNCAALAALLAWAPASLSEDLERFIDMHRGFEPERGHHANLVVVVSLGAWAAFAAHVSTDLLTVLETYHEIPEADLAYPVQREVIPWALGYREEA